MPTVNKNTVKPVDLTEIHKKLAKAHQLYRESLDSFLSRGHQILAVSTLLVFSTQFAACSKGRAVTAGGDLPDSPSSQSSQQIVQGEGREGRPGADGAAGAAGAPGHSPTPAEVVVGICTMRGMADAANADGTPTEACLASFNGRNGGDGAAGAAGAAGEAGHSPSISEVVVGMCTQRGIANAANADGSPSEACLASFNGRNGSDGAAGAAGEAGHSPSVAEVIIGMCTQRGMSQADATGADNNASPACLASFNGAAGGNGNDGAAGHSPSVEELRAQMSQALCGRPGAINAEGTIDDECRSRFVGAAGTPGAAGAAGQSQTQEDLRRNLSLALCGRPDAIGVDGRVDQRCRDQINGRRGDDGTIVASCEIQHFHHTFSAQPIPAEQLTDYSSHNGSSSTNAQLSLPYTMREAGNTRNTARLSVANYHDSQAGSGAPQNVMTVFDVAIAGLPDLNEIVAVPSNRQNITMTLRMPVEKYINTHNVQSNDSTESVCLMSGLRNCSGRVLGHQGNSTSTANFGLLVPAASGYTFVNNIFGDWIQAAFLTANASTPTAANQPQSVALTREFVGSVADVFGNQGSPLTQDQLRNLLYPNSSDHGNTLRFVASDDLRLVGDVRVDVSFVYRSCPANANMGLPLVDRSVPAATTQP